MAQFLAELKMTCQDGITSKVGEVARKTTDYFSKMDKAVDKFKGNTAKAGGFLSSTFGKLAALGGAYLGISEIKTQLGEMINKANEASTAQVMMTQSILKTKGATMESVKTLTDLADAQMKTGLMDDEAIKKGYSILASRKIQVNAIKLLSKSMQDYAAFNGGVNAGEEDIANSAMVMTKAMMGNTTMLQRSGIKMTENQKAIMLTGNQMQRAAVLAKVMQDRFGGMNETLAKTPAGQIKQLRVAIDEIRESLGNRLLPYVGKFVKVLKDNLPMIEQKAKAAFDKFEEMVPTLSKIYDAFVPIAGLIGDLVFKVAELGASFVEFAYDLSKLKSAKPLIVGVTAALAAYVTASVAAKIATINFNRVFSLSPLGKFVLLVGALTVAIEKLREVWDEFDSSVLDNESVISAMAKKGINTLPSGGAFGAAFKPLDYIPPMQQPEQIKTSQEAIKTGGGYGPTQQSVSVTAPITINPPVGSDSKEIAKMTAYEIDKAIKDSQARQNRRELVYGEQ